MKRLENKLDKVIDEYGLDDDEFGVCRELYYYVKYDAQHLERIAPMVIAMTSLNMANLYNEKDCDKVLFDIYEEEEDDEKK